MSSNLMLKGLIGIVVGGLGGAAGAALVGGTTAVGAGAGALFGLLFALLAARRAVSPGSTLSSPKHGASKCILKSIWKSGGSKRSCWRTKRPTTCLIWVFLRRSVKGAVFLENPIKFL